jgi:hypothetical protein
LLTPIWLETSELFNGSDWDGAPDSADEPKKSGKNFIHLSDKASRSITVLKY